ncbi:iron-containing redox enzyme family protein [bacterium]|nr:iron-containing redox enzyme family protein [bacterium]
MNLKQQFDAIVAEWDLNKHPFYESWRAGTLPVDTLRRYAEEYGQLVRLMPSGWSTLGSPDLVAEEEEHSVMWDDFASCLDTRVLPAAMLAETEAMVSEVSGMFSRPASAIGALYAFEVQQPATATSKLDGLREHYPQLSAELYEEYFKVHAVNHHESEAVYALAQQLDEAGQAEAVAACERMCKTLWNALSGIHGEDCAMA